MVVAAKRVSQRVNSADRRVGKGLTGIIGAEQHGLAGMTIIAIFAGRNQVR